MNGSDINPSESVPTIMVNVYSEQAFSVIVRIYSFSSFLPPGINISENYSRSFLLHGAWKQREIKP